MSFLYFQASSFAFFGGCLYAKRVKGVRKLADVNVFIAIFAGFLSFISPCCLPLYPAFLSYITGMSLGDMKEEKVLLQRRSFFHTIFFLVGFSIIFLAIGYGTTFVGQFFIQYQEFIRQIGAIFLIALGLVIVGILQPTFLMGEYKYTFKSRPSGYVGSMFIGVAFAAGWTPCTGPILVSVIALAATNPSSSLIYMIAYIIGFSIPFLMLSFFIGKLTWIKRHSEGLMKIGGGIMVIMGILLFFNWMTKITIFMTNLFGGFTGF